MPETQPLGQAPGHLKSTVPSSTRHGHVARLPAGSVHATATERLSICPGNNLRFPAHQFRGEIYCEYACAIYEYEYGSKVITRRRKVRVEALRVPTIIETIPRWIREVFGDFPPGITRDTFLSIHDACAPSIPRKARRTSVSLFHSMYPRPEIDSFSSLCRYSGKQHTLRLPSPVRMKITYIVTNGGARLCIECHNFEVHS